MDRRDLLAALALSPLFGVLPAFAQAQPVSAPAPKLGDPLPFPPGRVRALAQKLAAKKYTPPALELPKEMQDLSYDQYRNIRYRPEQSIWRGEKLPFELQFFHTAFLFKQPVNVYLAANGEARKLNYSTDLFSFGPSVTPPPANIDMGFAGFRIHTPINKPDYYDEVAVFQGASYFRAVAKNQSYGLSARGLAIDTAEPTGEEFPIFRSFWIEKPVAESNSIVVHALLDSPRTTGAYRFTIRPGDATEMDVEVALYPRTSLAKPGFAPLTSMYFFGSNDRVGVDDFRPSVHDSDGLSIHNGRGEWLWRPLLNPSTLQISSFADHSPRGFGLMQRSRGFDAFQDLEAHYEKRPSLWIEPIGDWGPGAVHLVEIPSKAEINDNIVAYWRPAAPLPGGSEYVLNYRMKWDNAPMPLPGLATVLRTKSGAGPNLALGIPTTKRLYVIDLIGEPLQNLPPDAVLEPVIEASSGEISSPVVQANSETGGHRMSFELKPGDAAAIELRAYLSLGGNRISEVWTCRWTT